MKSQTLETSNDELAQSLKKSGFVGKDRLYCSCKYDNILYHNPVGNHMFGFAVIFSNLERVGKHLKELQGHTQADTIRQIQSYLYRF